MHNVAEVIRADNPREPCSRQTVAILITIAPPGRRPPRKRSGCRRRMRASRVTQESVDATGKLRTR